MELNEIFLENNMSSNKTTIYTDYILMLYNENNDHPLDINSGGDWLAGHVFEFNKEPIIVRSLSGDKSCFKISAGNYICFHTGTIIPDPRKSDTYDLEEGEDYVYIPWQALPFLKKPLGKKCGLEIICTGFEDCVDCDKMDCKYRE